VPAGNRKPWQVERVAIRLERVDPHIERGAAHQRRRRLARDARTGERRHQPIGREARPGLYRLIIFQGRFDRSGAMRRTVEQVQHMVVRRIRAAIGEHGVAAIARHGAERTDRGIDQLAHRPAVLRPGIAARAEIVREDAVGGRPLPFRRLDHGIEHLDRGLNAGGGGHAGRESLRRQGPLPGKCRPA
jgi:hypothetical protein